MCVVCVTCVPVQAEQGSLPRPGVAGDADKLLELVNKLAAAKGGDSKVEVDEGLVRKFASGQDSKHVLWAGRGTVLEYGWEGEGDVCVLLAARRSCG